MCCAQEVFSQFSIKTLESRGRIQKPLHATFVSLSDLMIGIFGDRVIVPAINLPTVEVIDAIVYNLIAAQH